ncbi:hypothetical protein [Streptomyces sp. CdTB01]|uniref:hypothetical protein n=1 Tax=Streptomyces sp. CdTB01 TaxID=1725411 RepID=UPI00073A5608|nr:hypothetical protein [Streptomyces sp. CdTB01]ALV37882.1 hypothetical protein AS200_41845 [Streptomyces sp. CdTB01]
MVQLRTRGGSQFDVAVGLARLGRRIGLTVRLADKACGRMPRAHATAEGIDRSRSPAGTEPTPLTVVFHGPAGTRRLRLLPRRHRGLAVDTGRGRP